MRFIGLFAVIFALTCSLASAQEQRFSIDEAKFFAQRLLNDGQPQATLQIVSVIVQNRPEDSEALILVASASRELGRTEQSISAARKAYASTAERDIKYVAARLIAVGLAEQEKFSRAQYWLRIARQNAPNARESNQVAQEYQVLRQVNPWSFNASFGVAPSGNINGGSQGNTSYLEENVSQDFKDILAGAGIFDPDTGLRLLGENERALSGTEATLGFSAQYRLEQSASSATFLSTSANLFRYRLSSEAREQSGSSSNGDFSRDSLSFGIRHIRTVAEGQRPATFSLNYGRSWYAGSSNRRYISASFSQPYLLSPQELLTFGVDSSVSASFSNDIPVRSYGASLQLLRILPSTDRIGSSIRVSKSASEILDSNYTSLSVGVNYAFSRPIMGLGVSLTSNATFTSIGETRFAPFDREEHSVRLGADISVPQAEIFGFQPVVKLEAAQTKSTVDQFDSRTYNIGLDFKSSF